MNKINLSGFTNLQECLEKGINIPGTGGDPEGTIHKWKGGTYKKTNGKWIKIKTEAKNTSVKSIPIIEGEEIWDYKAPADSTHILKVEKLYGNIAKVSYEGGVPFFLYLKEVQKRKAKSMKKEHKKDSSSTIDLPDLPDNYKNETLYNYKYEVLKRIVEKKLGGKDFEGQSITKLPYFYSLNGLKTKILPKLGLDYKEIEKKIEKKYKSLNNQ